MVADTEAWAQEVAACCHPEAPRDRSALQALGRSDYNSLQAEQGVLRGSVQLRFIDHGGAADDKTLYVRPPSPAMVPLPTAAPNLPLAQSDSQSYH